MVIALQPRNILFAEYWPTEEWQTSTAESQGMNSEKLNQLNVYVKEKVPATSSVLVVRNGYIVFEEYYKGEQDDLRDMFSATKSVTSALIGIAIQEGHIKSIDDKMIDYIPEFETEKMTPQAREITIKQLLTMTAGFSPDIMGIAFPDKIQAMLELPLKSNPGQIFTYNSTATNLLSMIITNTTDSLAVDFGDEYLFESLGITDFRWQDMILYTIGSQGLRFTTRDMAKIGYLYLHDGMWDDSQIVPKEWVAESTDKQVEVSDTDTWISDGYGYQWWIGTTNGLPCYMAFGFDGQHICVIPELEMVIVITAGEGGITKIYLPLIDDIIVPATM
jgi:CubicO group peptidase (beta-lactamase class C family)